MRQTRSWSVLLWLALVSMGGAVAGAAGAQSLPDSVPAKAKISKTMGSFTGPLQASNRFGSAIAWLGDFDGDGLGDAAVGANAANSIWLLRLSENGTVLSHTKIGTGGAGGFTGTLPPVSGFGSAIASLGDLDADGVGDLAVGASLGSATGKGAVWILLLNADGTVKANVEISATGGGFGGTLPLHAAFGYALAAAGDLDQDGVTDLFVRSPGDNDSGFASGAVWILYLNADGTVKSQSKINALHGGFTGPLLPGDIFGSALARLGDLDGNGADDLAVGAPADDDGGNGRGAVWILFMDPSQLVIAQSKISDLAGGFTGLLADTDRFGAALATLADFDGDGAPELAVGALGDGSGFQIAPDHGAVWLLSLAPDGTVQDQQKIANQGAGMGGSLDQGDVFGSAIAPFAVPADGTCRGMMVGAPGDDDGDVNAGAAWSIFLTAGTWTNLGGALAGQYGVPLVTHAGVLCAGNPLSLMMQTGQGIPVAFILVIGASVIDIPFSGGTLVPAPNLVYFGVTDPEGNLTVTGLWPKGVPSGFTTIFQFWVHDPQPPGSLSASDALKAAAP